MNRKCVATLIVLALLLTSVLTFFMVWQYRRPKPKPEFRLVAASEELRNTKENQMLKAELMGSVAKNSRNNLKGPVPDSLELDIGMRTEQKDSMVKLFQSTYMHIPGFKAYTLAFKAKLPVSRYTFGRVEQRGLPTDVPLDAVLTYFKEGKPQNPPMVVCTVTCINKRAYECFLMDRVNVWSRSTYINSLDIDDEEFGALVAKEIASHYGTASSASEPSREEGSMQSSYGKADSVISDDSDDSQSLVYELDISKKESDLDDFVKVSKLKKNAPEGFNAYWHKVKGKMTVSNYKLGHQQQLGLLTDTPMDGLITFYNQDKEEEKPLGVCLVISKSTSNLACYLSDKENSWVKNQDFTQLDPTDPEYGVKLFQILAKHYTSTRRHSLPEMSGVSTNMYPDGYSTPELSLDYQDLEPEDDSDDDSVDLEEPRVLDLDLSKQTSNFGDFVRVTEVKEVTFPGFKAFYQTFQSASKVTSYKNKDQEQMGLPTDTEFEAVITLFKEDMLDDLPLVVCPVTSLALMTFECYVRDSQNTWSRDETLSQMDSTDDNFGEQFIAVVKAHYGLEG